MKPLRHGSLANGLWGFGDPHVDFLGDPDDKGSADRGDGRARAVVGASHLYTQRSGFLDREFALVRKQGGTVFAVRWERCLKWFRISSWLG